MNLKKTLYDLVENNATVKGKYFDYFIQLLIILSLISFSLETLPDLSTELISYLHLFEVFTIAVFSFEYLIRIWVSKNL